MLRPTSIVLGLAVLGVWACNPEPEPQAFTEPGPGEGVWPTFDESAFDALVWSSDEVALARGQAVYEANCLKCHGITGAGEGGYLFGGQTLQPPSWLIADWPLARDPMALRRYIFSGSVGGMPYWGIAGVSPRDIDAVARYITEVLRPTYGERAATD